jgi:hypothetical protein
VGELLLLAVASAFYPLYLAVVVVAFTTDNPSRVLFPYLLGAFTALIPVGLLLVLAFDGASFTRDQRSPLSPALDITIGCLLVLAALVLRRWRTPDPATQKQGLSTRMLSGGKVSLAAAAGLLMNLVPGPAYVIGLKNIAVGDYSTGEEIALIVGFNLIQLSLIELPLIGGVLAPARTAEFAKRFNAWLRRNGRLLVAAVSAALGIYLIARGLYLLVT